MSLPFAFDFKNPNYSEVWAWRIATLQKIRADPHALAAIKTYYKTNEASFITHWGSTYDPRNVDIDLPTTFPFVLFPLQEDWIAWVLDCWRSRKPGITEKSRDMGMSWLSIALSCTLCIFNEGVSIGFGSRKHEYVDKLGDSKSLFWKARLFMSKLPVEFRGSWNVKTDAPEMQIRFPDTGSLISGEAGDGIGRGDRKSIYFVDESAHLERPGLVDASLSATTNCRQDISSAKGMGNSFAQRRFSGRIAVFTYHHKDDPRKDDAWYAKMQEELDPVTLAQEIDINYNASIEGMVIPSEWAQAAIDAALKLKLEVTGGWFASLDLADQGSDLNACAIRKGIELRKISAWSGQGSDSLYTCQRAASMCDETGCTDLQYDADGLGSFTKSDWRIINEHREVKLKVVPFHGSGAVGMPEKDWTKGRKNKDFFMNRKAQSWFHLRQRFQTTFRAIKGGEYDPEDIISIPSDLPDRAKLIMELSQPTYKLSTTGKVVIDKTPDNTRSPNMADALMMLYAPPKRGMGLF